MEAQKRCWRCGGEELYFSRTEPIGYFCPDCGAEDKPSSADSIPSGLTLYAFDYPDGMDRGECAADTQFLETDENARWFMRTYGATRATNVITGDIIFPNAQAHP